MSKIYKLLFGFLWMLLSFNAIAQKNFFSIAKSTEIQELKGKRDITPQKFRSFKLNIIDLKVFLWTLPSEKEISSDRSNAPILELPMPDGSMAKFHVWESSIMEKGLASKYSEMKTFAGQGIDDRYATARFDYNPYFGLSVQILSAASGDIYIDPYEKWNVNYYISYYKKDNNRIIGSTCETKTDISPRDLLRPESIAAGPCRGTSIITYRLAMACTGEYAVAVCSPNPPTIAATAAKILTSVNRVDGVYERDVTVRFNLISNNDLLIYLDGATDPYTNGNGTACLSQNITNCNAVIGSANFDIGHVFTTASGGVAGLGVVCTASKARGTTGVSNPIGDGFDIDFVAHEIGHQFNANHTFNSNESSNCGPNRNGSTAYEPGSGTSIMAYAGVCASGENLQPNSDVGFHAVSFDEISNFLQAAGGTCGVSTTTNNNIPTIAPLSNSGLTIPINTPFTLTGTATDADGDALTYSWEEWDLGPGTFWNQGNTNTSSPLFRYREPMLTGSRTFPDPRYIAANFLPAVPPTVNGGLKGETLPTQARNLNFRFTVRDNRAGGGGIASAGNGCQISTPFTLSTSGTAPFIVTLPNGGESYSGGSSQIITWNVVGTNAAPFNVANVKISYSTDGGLTFPTVLSASTVNDGTEPLTIPVGLTTTARIKVEAIGNIFFDISNANFTVTAPVNDFNFSATTASTSACPAPTNPTVTIPTTVSGTFTTPINLSATSGVPAGTTVTFAPNPLTPGASTIATLNNASTLSYGTYTITVTGTAGSSTKTTTITYIITAGAGPTLTMVANQTVCVPSTATFTVSTVTTPVTYQWQSSPTIGGTYTNIATATSASYTTGASSASMNGMGFRCVVSTQCSSTTSNNALLTVNTSAAITTQPTNQPACTGNTATFTGAASGTGVTYQWQSSTTGGAGTFTNISGATNASYTTPVITGTTPGFYQLVATTTTCPGTATSNVAQLTINVTASIGTQPSAQTVCAPATATFIVAATGSGLSYQWQVATAAAPTTFNNVGTNSNNYTTSATSAGMNGNIYRVIVTGSCNAITSNNAILTVNTAAFLTGVVANPSNTTVCNGATISFTATASGTGVSYQWQRAVAATPTVFVDVVGASNAAYTTVALTPVMNGDVYRVIVTTTTCPNSVNSTPIVITVNTVAVISAQPTAQTTCVPNPATFTVAATGSGLTYQWQRALAITPTAFADITGATNASHTTPVTVLTDNGNMYRVNILSTCSPSTPTTSNAVMLTVNNPVSVTQNPISLSGCAGDNYTFSVTATGTSITYQWQVASAQSPTVFVNISGATSAIYTVTNAPSFFSGNLYRVVISAACVGGAPGGITTPAVSLTLSAKPAVVLTAPVTSNNNPAVNTMIYATVSPANLNILYSWKRNGVIIPSAIASASLTISVDDQASYELTVTDVSTGCQSTSNIITTSALRSDNLLAGKVFIYPNPVRTTMQVRFNNSTSANRATILNIYDEKGVRVFSKSYSITGTSGRMDVNMGGMQNGTYMVYIMDNAGNRLGGSKVVKIN